VTTIRHPYIVQKLLHGRYHLIREVMIDERHGVKSGVFSVSIVHIIKHYVIYLKLQKIKKLWHTGTAYTNLPITECIRGMVGRVVKIIHFK
jgi:hypothetical protein